jgi:hypothetical protein
MYKDLLSFLNRMSQVRVLSGSPTFSTTYSLFLKNLKATGHFSGRFSRAWLSINRTSRVVNVTSLVHNGHSELPRATDGYTNNGELKK